MFSDVKAKLEVNRAGLSAAFSSVSAVVPTRTLKPILQNVKLKCVGDDVWLIGTDNEISIQYHVADVKLQGRSDILLPTKRVNDILRELRDDVLTLELGDDQLRLLGGRSEFKLPVADPAEYPEVPQFNADSYFTIPGRLLKAMIRRTAFATDPDSARYALGGVAFEFSATKLILVATDSRRLALASAPSATSGDPIFPMVAPVVPVKAMYLLERTIPDTDDLVKMAVDSNGQIQFQAANATISSKLVEGRFPKYQDVVPKSHAVSIDLVAGAFYAVVRQSMIVTNEESRGVDFSIDNGMMTLTSRAAEIGTSTVELPIDYPGAPMEIRLDPRFIGDFLKVVPAESQVTLRMIDDESPATLLTNDGYTYVTMPLSREG